MRSWARRARACGPSLFPEGALQSCSGAQGPCCSPGAAAWTSVEGICPPGGTGISALCHLHDTTARLFPEALSAQSLGSVRPSACLLASCSAGLFRPLSSTQPAPCACRTLILCRVASCIPQMLSASLLAWVDRSLDYHSRCVCVSLVTCLPKETLQSQVRKTSTFIFFQKF